MSENNTPSFWSTPWRIFSPEGREFGDARMTTAKRGTTGKEGVRIFREMLGNVPPSLAYNKRALDFQFRGQLKEAEREYKKALKSDSQNVYTLNNLGSVLTAQGKIAGAISFLRRVIEVDPFYAPSDNN